jgi:hypothetical protein
VAAIRVLVLFSITLGISERFLLFPHHFSKVMEKKRKTLSYPLEKSALISSTHVLTQKPSDALQVSVTSSETIGLSELKERILALIPNIPSHDVRLRGQGGGGLKQEQ